MSRSCFEPGGCVYEFNGGCAPLPPNVAHRLVNSTGCFGRGVFSKGEEEGYRLEEFTQTLKSGETFHVRRWVKDVTWDEVMAERRHRQRARLAAIHRDVTEKRALRITVQFYGAQVGLGWHVYFQAAGAPGRGFEDWRRDDIKFLLERFPLMQWDAPLVEARTGHQWMEAFARKYQVGITHRQPKGSLTCWALCRGETILKLL